MTEEQEYQVLVLQEGADMVSVSRAGQLVDSFFTATEFRAPADFKTATAPAGHSKNNTVPISWLEENMTLPKDFINNIPAGSMKFFANQAGLRLALN